MQPDVGLPPVPRTQIWRCHAQRVEYNIFTLCRRGSRAQQQPAAAISMPIQGSKAAKWKQRSCQLRAAMQAARPGQVTRRCDCCMSAQNKTARKSSGAVQDTEPFHEQSFFNQLCNKGAGVCSPCRVRVSHNSGPQAALDLCSCMMWRRLSDSAGSIPACRTAQLADMSRGPCSSWAMTVLPGHSQAQPAQHISTAHLSYAAQLQTIPACNSCN